MERLENFELSRWIKEDLISLLEEYPTLFEMNENDLRKLIKEKYSMARCGAENSTILKNEAIVLQKYYDVKYNNIESYKNN